MEDRDMASERSERSVLSAGLTMTVTSLPTVCTDHRPHPGKRAGADSVSQSNEDLNLSNSSDLLHSSLNDSDETETLNNIETGIEALTDSDLSFGGGELEILDFNEGEIEEEEESETGEGSESERDEGEMVSCSPHDDSDLTPMPSLDDSAFFKPLNGSVDDSSRISSNDDGSKEASRGEGRPPSRGENRGESRGEWRTEGRPPSSSSDLSSPQSPFSSIHEIQEDRDWSRGGHASDSGTRLHEGSSISVNSSSSIKSSLKGSDKKKKGNSWYSVLSPTYKSRSVDFKRLFKVIPNTERLMVDYSCALQKEILVQGRLYITQNWVCFYANIFRWETVLTIRCSSITSVTKEKTARVIPNAIQVCADGEKYFFTSFGARDKSYLMLFRVWQNALMDQPMSPQELWQWVHHSYGDDLGLTSSDDDYQAPTQDDEENFQKILTLDEMSEDKEIAEEAEVVLNRGENGHVLPIQTQVPQKSHHTRAPPSSDNLSTLTNSTNGCDLGGTDDGAVPPLRVPPTTTLEVPSPGSQMSAEIGTDTTEEDEEEDLDEVQCPHDEHRGFVTLDDVYDLTCDQLFELLFTESDFYKDFVSARKTYDLLLSPWPVEPDVENHKTRMITYTLSLNYSIGPKCSPSTEKQTLYGESKPGALYVIDCEVVNGGIPYSDNFYTINHYCITRVNSRKARLLISSEIKYRKNVWGLVKNLVEKNAHAGLQENFQLLATRLRVEEECRANLSAPTTKSLSPPRVKKRRRRRPHPTGERGIATSKRPSESLPPTTVHAKGIFGEDWQVQFNADTLVRVVCTVLLLLVIFNALLFYKLWSLETRASSPRFDQHAWLHNLGGERHSQEEWMSLLEQQQELHDAEMERWRDILATSVDLMDKMKLILEGLHSSLDKRPTFPQRTAPPPPA